jgi:quercetin dioxygenase-like cupin family protein
MADPQPRVVWIPGGVRTEIHLDGEATGGAFTLLVDHPPPGWSLPAHRHRNEAETIHVVEGEFEMRVDGRRHVLRAGETIHVPRGVVHSGANVGERPGRRVLVFSPAGMERFFLEAGAATPGAEVDTAALLSLAVRYGWEFQADERRSP